MNTKRPMYNENLEKEFKELIDKKVYLNNGITVKDFADACHTNISYMSKYIHTTYNLTFYEFIGKKRVEYSLELIKKKPHYTFTNLLHLCGFASYENYTRNLKKFYNLTIKDLMDLYKK